MYSSVVKEEEINTESFFDEECEKRVAVLKSLVNIANLFCKSCKILSKLIDYSEISRDGEIPYITCLVADP